MLQKVLLAFENVGLQLLECTFENAAMHSGEKMSVVKSEESSREFMHSAIKRW